MYRDLLDVKWPEEDTEMISASGPYGELWSDLSKVEGETITGFDWSLLCR